MGKLLAWSYTKKRVLLWRSEWIVNRSASKKLQKHFIVLAYEKKNAPRKITIRITPGMKSIHVGQQFFCEPKKKKKLCNNFWMPVDILDC